MDGGSRHRREPQCPPRKHHAPRKLPLNIQLEFVLHYRLRVSSSPDKPSDENCWARRQLSRSQGVIFEIGWCVFMSWRDLPDDRFLVKVLGKLGSQIERHDATHGSNAVISMKFNNKPGESVGNKDPYRKMMMSVMDRSSFPRGEPSALLAASCALIVRFGSRIANKIDANPIIAN
jgi:hypothetical protein